MTRRLLFLLALVVLLALSGCATMTTMRINGQLGKIMQAAEADKRAALDRAHIRNDQVGINCLTMALRPENKIIVELPIGPALAIEIHRTGLISPELRAACTPWLLGVGQQRFP